MKDLIVLISTIILGIAIAFMVMGFKTDAQNITDSVSGSITDLVTEFEAGGE